MDVYKCPECSNHCTAQFEHNGIGNQQVTPHHCATCGWTEPCPYQESCTDRCVSYSYCSNRKEPLEDFKNDLAERFFGNKREEGKCVNCSTTKVKRCDFDDEISWKEFSISYFCQECQDKTFK